MFQIALQIVGLFLIFALVVALLFLTMIGTVAVMDAARRFIFSADALTKARADIEEKDKQIDQLEAEKRELKGLMDQSISVGLALLLPGRSQDRHDSDKD